MSEKNADDKRPSISRRNAIKTAGTLGTGALVLSGLGTSAGASSSDSADYEPPEGPPSDLDENWRDVPWENAPDHSEAPDPEDVDEAEVTEAMGDPDNWELYFHDEDKFESIERYVGKDRDAEPDSSISTMSTWTYTIQCWNPPFIEEGCFDVTATAHWNQVSFAIRLWEYELWGGEIEWAPDSVSVSFRFTWKGVRFEGTVGISLGHQIGDDTWEVCINGEACVYSENWCADGSICFDIEEP